MYYLNRLGGYAETQMAAPDVNYAGSNNSPKPTHCVVGDNIILTEAFMDCRAQFVSYTTGGYVEKHMPVHSSPALHM